MIKKQGTSVRTPRSGVLTLVPNNITVNLLSITQETLAEHCSPYNLKPLLHLHPPPLYLLKRFKFQQFFWMFIFLL